MSSEKSPRRVLIVSNGIQGYDAIRALLPKEEYSPVTYAGSAEEARKLLASGTFDILFINAPLSDGSGLELARAFVDRPMGILLICSKESYEKMREQAGKDGIPVLARPLSKQLFSGVMQVLASVSIRLGKMAVLNRNLEEKMTDLRVVNRAKWLLIGQLKMSEEDAHYYIEKQAMDTRLSRREIAEHIIRTYDQ